MATIPFALNYNVYMFIQHNACIVPRLFVDSLSANVVLLLSTGNKQVLSVGISVEMTMGGSFRILYVCVCK